MDIFLQALVNILEPGNIAAVVIGTLGGVLIGSLPGLNAPIGIALMLPFTFGMNPASALLLVGGLYMGASYGGSISATLLNTPGTEAAACTAIEGYPMAKQGRAKEALNLSVLCSSLGGIIGVLVLIFLTPPLATFALKFGPPEMFLVALASLGIVGSLCSKSLKMGLFATAFGILISSVGPDIMWGTFRLTFGVNELNQGIPLVPAMIGLFAIAEMLGQSGNRQGESILNVPMEDSSPKEVLKSLLKRPALWIRGSLIGTIIGILPGTGATVASFIAYGEAKRISKNPGLFGKGNPEGIMAAESANNAAVGGSLVPLLSLGIPGSAAAAVIFGVLSIHGLMPGPRLFSQNADIVYTFMLGMIPAIFAMAIIGVYGVKYAAKVLKVKFEYLIPIVLALCVFGSYSVRNSVFDVVLAIVFGAIGLLMKRMGIPVVPVVLGIILGPIIEENFRQCLIIIGAQGISMVNYFIGRPLTVVLFLLFLILVYINFRGALKGSDRDKEVIG